MALSTEEFAELVQCIALRPERDQPRDKRRAPRINAAARVTILPVSEEKAPALREICLQDISSRGISFMQNRSVPRGQQFILQLPRPKGQSPTRLLCSVVYCRPSRGLFRVGAEFVCLLDAQPRPQSAAADIQRIRQSVLG